MNRCFIGSLAVFFMAVCMRAGIAAGSFVVLMAAGGAVDVRKGVIPNRVCLLVAVSGICQGLICSGDWAGLKAAAVLITGLVLLMLRLVLKDGIGMGDIKLLIACSFSLSVYSLTAGMAIACALAAAGGLAITKSFKGQIPLGPFLAVSMTVMKLAESM